MAAQERSFVEICGFEREPRRRFREVNVSLGGPPGPGPGWGTFPDSAGAYHYEESGEMQSATRNRFIHWSSCGGVVQLEEACLDGDLLNGGVRLRFDGGVLPGAVCICETASSVGVLILTTRSAHRLLLPHPRRMYRSELVPEQSLQSVFTDVGRLGLEDPAHSAPLPPSAGLTGGPGATAAWLSPQGHAHFAVASPAGGVVLLTLPPQDAKGELLVVELRRSSVMRKLSGWLPSMRGDHPPGDLVLSLAVRELEADAFLFALCADHRLRMWSLKEQACLLEADLLDFLPSPRGPRPPSPAGPGGGGPPRLRLAFSPSTGLCLGVFLGGRRGQFTVLQLLVADGERYSLEHISTLFSSQETLVDFTLTSSDVWALWVDEANAAVVKYISYEHSAAGQWNQVFVQPPPEEEVPIGVDLDPRETFLDILFSPLRFTAGAILRALQIFHRGSEGLLDPSWETLKKEVTLAVERKIQSSVTESEFSQEDYRQLQVEFWSRFYSCCLQYQEAEAAPLGLTVSPHSGMACLLRKGFLSFLLPCFAVDHLYLSSDEHLLTEDETPMAEDPEVGRDVLQLVQSLRLVSDAVTADMAYEMERAVEELQPPEKPAEQVLEEMLRSDSDNVIVDIQNKLQDVRNPVAAMMVLLREMDLETDADLGAEGAPGPGLAQLYAGTVAVSTVCQAVGHLAMTRARFCRDLLILQKLYLRFGDNVFLGGGAQLLQLQQDLIPRTSHLLSSYHVLRHASQRLATPTDSLPDPNPNPDLIPRTSHLLSSYHVLRHASQRLATPTDSLDMNVLQLTHLELSDNPPTGPRPGPGPQTVVELFYRAGGRRCAVSHLLAETSGPAPLPWGHMTCSLVHLLAQLLWPSNPSFQFPEVLMAHCQYTQLQEYVRLVSPWCQVNIGSCRFMLAQCYLASGEGQKALQCFQEAANEVEKEDFLLRLTGSEENAPSPRLQFYNKVLRLLEDVGLPELVIQLASLAVTEATGDVSSQAALWTRVFRHHLALGHNSEAYEALTQNPDGGMQLDCLRQLVVVLCERRQLHDLVRFPYVGLHEEVG
ncbi:nuclear pore complex protein Nup160-like [Menidia menidia]